METYLIILVALCFSAFFSGMEIAYISSNKLRIALDQKQGSLSTNIISFFANNPSQYIATILVGNNIALVIYGLFMAIVLEPMLSRFIEPEGFILLAQTVISTLIILLTAEFLPKTIFRINPNLSLKIFSVPLLFFFILFYLPTYLILKFSNFLFKRILRSKNSEEIKKFEFGKVDLSNLIKEVKTDDQPTEAEDPEIKIFQNALLFSELKVRDCMIPRPDIVAVEINTSMEEIKEKFIETGLSKILVYDDNNDNIIGYFSSKELFKNPKDIKSHIMEVIIVPETMPANKLLTKFIQEHKSIAVIVDEFGGTSGMITIEDIIEEIFGEIEDEHDTIEFIDKQISEKEFVFSGRIEIDDLNEKYALGIPASEDYDTLAGYIFFYYEQVPTLHETIIINGYEFKILKMSNTRLELVKMRILD